MPLVSWMQPIPAASTAWWKRGGALGIAELNFKATPGLLPSKLLLTTCLSACAQIYPSYSDLYSSSIIEDLKRNRVFPGVKHLPLSNLAHLHHLVLRLLFLWFLLYLFKISRLGRGAACPLTMRESVQTTSGHTTIISNSSASWVKPRATGEHNPECQALIEDLC
jgi:hypothetical protein